MSRRQQGESSDQGPYDGPAARGRWQRYRPPARDEVTRETRDTEGDPLPELPPPAPRRRGLSLGVGVGGLLVATAVGAGVVFATGGVGEQAPTPYPAEKSYRPILTPAVADAIGAALEQETGSTQVLSAWVDDRDQVRLVVPPPPGDDLAEQWTWDGTALEKMAAEQPGDRVPFGWEQVDPDVLVALDEEARSRSDGDISDSRARIEQPVDDYSEWIYVKVDEVDHGGVALWADLDGTVESDLVYEDWRDD